MVLYQVLSGIVCWVLMLAAILLRLCGAGGWHTAVIWTLSLVAALLAVVTFVAVPRRSRSDSKALAGIALGILWFLAVGILTLMPHTQPPAEAVRLGMCQTKLYAIRAACEKHAAAHEGRFPVSLSDLPKPVAFNGMTFADAASCPSQGSEAKPTSRSFYHYVSGLRSEDPAWYVVAYDPPSIHAAGQSKLGPQCNVLYMCNAVGVLSHGTLQQILRRQRAEMSAAGR